MCEWVWVWVCEREDAWQRCLWVKRESVSVCERDREREREREGEGRERCAYLEVFLRPEILWVESQKNLFWRKLFHCPLSLFLFISPFSFSSLFTLLHFSFILLYFLSFSPFPHYFFSSFVLSLCSSTFRIFLCFILSYSKFFDFTHFKLFFLLSLFFSFFLSLSLSLHIFSFFNHILPSLF